MKFYAALFDNTRQQVPARRFSFDFNGRRFWFALHKPVYHPASANLVVSHWASGRVCTVIQPGTRLAAARAGTSDRDLARQELAARFALVGEQKIFDALVAAEA